MTTKTDSRRREIMRLKRQIEYHCGVIARTMSRERIQRAHAVIRLHEQQLLEMHSADTQQGSHDGKPR